MEPKNAMNQPLSVPPILREKAKENEPSRRIARVLHRWIAFADRNFHEWDHRPNAGYFMDGAYWYGMETSLPMYIYTVLAAFGDYDETLSGVPRERLRDRAIASLRYLCFTHDTGPEDCVRPSGKNQYNSGNKWGGKHAPFFQATQTGSSVVIVAFTAWVFWNELDEETRLMAERLVISYAERWSQVEPRDGSFYDTQSEENAWTATGILAAVTLFPDHPERARWQDAYLKWNINSATVSHDRHNQTEYRGAPLREKWIRTSTLFPDYTTENHGMVHPNYVASAISFRSVYCILTFMQGASLDETVLWNNNNVYEKTIKLWTQFDGLPIPIQSQDWWYNRQHDALLVHTCMNVVHGNADAARLEQTTMATIEGLQASHSTGCLLEEDGEQYAISPKDFQTAKDFESLSAYTLALSYMLHLFGGPGVAPSDDQEMRERLSRVYTYPYGSVAISRTPDSFSSFSWRNRVMALTLPSKGLWTITPMENSYIGKVVFADDGKAEITPSIGGLVTEIEDTSHMIKASEQGFSTVASISHGEGRVRQKIAFVALPNGNSIYVEQFTIVAPCRIAAMYTGLIGVRNEKYSALPELAPGRRSIHVGGRVERFSGFFGKEDDTTRRFPPVPFVNVDDQIGYILFGTNGIRYDNRHRYPKWKAIEDCLVLNEREAAEFKGGETLPPFVVVTLPNRTAAQTKEALNQFVLLESSVVGTVLVEMDGGLVFANLLDRKQQLTGSRKLATSASPSIRVYDGRTCITGGEYTWSFEAAGRQAGFIEHNCTLESQQMGSAELEIVRSTGCIAFVNLSITQHFHGLLQLAGSPPLPIQLAPGSGTAIRQQ